MDAMTDLCPNSSTCREITVKLCWTHLWDGDTSLGGEQTGFEAASAINDYNSWCEQMASIDGEVPMYQWPEVDENEMDFFYGAAFGRPL